jgi:hypothetical protein
MQIFSFLCFLSIISFSIGSQLYHDDTKLLVSFAKICKSPSLKNRQTFSIAAENFYNSNFLESIKLANRQGCAFQTAFIDSVVKHINGSHCKKILYLIRTKLTNIFQTESDREAIKLLLKMAGKSQSKNSPISERDFLALKYVYEKISFDYFDDDGFNYYISLIHNFGDVMKLLNPPADTENPSQELFNLCSRLAVQLSNLPINYGVKFFVNDSIKQIRPFLVYLILHFNGSMDSFGLSVKFSLDQNTCVSKIISLLSGNTISKMATFLEGANISCFSLFFKLKYGYGIETFSQILNSPIENPLDSCEVICLNERTTLNGWDKWVLKGLIEINRYIRPRTLRLKV